MWKYGIKKHTIKGESVDVDGDVDFLTVVGSRYLLSLVRWVVILTVITLD
jgi:hypothetical protein